MIRRALAVWREDELLRRIVANTGYLFSSNTLSIVLSALQSALAARLLGVASWGTLGVVTGFVASVDRLFSFRMGELVVKYVGQYLTEGKKPHAAAIVKAAALTEAASGLAAFAVVVLLAPFAAAYIAKDPATRSLFLFYGLYLFGNAVVETATALLQVGDHFRSQAGINLAQNVLTLGVTAYAFVTNGDLGLVLLAYLLGKLAFGLGLTGWAGWRARRLLGEDWWRAPLSLLPPAREFWRFALSSNFSGTVNLVTRDSEVLWVSYFLSPLEAGYYKTALSLINLILVPINPFISTSFPEITRAAAERAWGRLRTLLRRLTIISGAWTALVVVGLLFLGNVLIGLMYGNAFVPATSAALVLLIGFGVANILYWNRPLLLSLDQPTYPLKVMAFAGIVKVALSFVLVPRYGYLAEAALLSAFFVVSVGLIVWRGLGEIGRRESADGLQLND